MSTAINFFVMYVGLYFNEVQIAKSKLKSRIRLDLEIQNQMAMKPEILDFIALSFEIIDLILILIVIIGIKNVYTYKWEPYSKIGIRIRSILNSDSKGLNLLFFIKIGTSSVYKKRSAFVKQIKDTPKASHEYINEVTNLDFNYIDKSIQGDTNFYSTGTGLDNTIDLNYTYIKFNL